MPGTPGSGRPLSHETRLVLVAAGDDFFLEDAFKEATERAGGGMSDPAVETLPDDITPEDVAVELNSPSLFNPERVLLVPDASKWVIASSSPGGPSVPSRKNAKAVDELVRPLLKMLEGGIPEGAALVMGVWCGAKPTGSLAKAVEASGSLEWIATPEPPKPWEDCAVSDAQKTVLRRLMSRDAPTARFAPAAESLLFERLGFAPRRFSRMPSSAGTPGPQSNFSTMPGGVFQSVIGPEVISTEEPWVSVSSTWQSTPSPGCSTSGALHGSSAPNPNWTPKPTRTGRGTPEHSNLVLAPSSRPISRLIPAHPSGVAPKRAPSPKVLLPGPCNGFFGGHRFTRTTSWSEA